MSVTKEEIAKKREYLRFLTMQIYKNRNKLNTLNKQVNKINQQINNYSDEKVIIFKWLKENSKSSF